MLTWCKKSKRENFGMSLPTLSDLADRLDVCYDEMFKSVLVPTDFPYFNT